MNRLKPFTIAVQVALAVAIAMGSIWLGLQQVSSAPPSDQGVASATQDLNKLLALAGAILAAAIAALTVRYLRSNQSGALVVIDLMAALLLWLFTPGRGDMPLALLGLISLALVGAALAGVGSARAMQSR